jgi:hypothetical protein
MFQAPADRPDAFDQLEMLAASYTQGEEVSECEQPEHPTP